MYEFFLSYTFSTNQKISGGIISGATLDNQISSDGIIFYPYHILTRYNRLKSWRQVDQDLFLNYTETTLTRGSVMVTGTATMTAEKTGVQHARNIKKS